MRGSPTTPQGHDFPLVMAPRLGSVRELDESVATCRACPRLVAWREEAARVKRKAFRDWDYWARPVPGFGPTDAPLAIIGLAPAAHGGNRTGRIFTGDPSGDVLYAALYDLGLASQPVATHRGDGMKLYGVRITMPVHCAPPANRPTTTERDTCRPWLARELELLRPTLGAIVVLGGFAWQALLPVLSTTGWQVPRPRPPFGHGAHAQLTDARSERVLHLLGGYHPSQRNVSTHTDPRHAPRRTAPRCRHRRRGCPSASWVTLTTPRGAGHACVKGREPLSVRRRSPGRERPGGLHARGPETSPGQEPFLASAHE